ncbi:MAG: 4Fe-4S binding protein [Deinococcales bacterium]
MLKGFFDAVINLTDPRPHYVGERCLLEKNAVGGCDKCAVACPHDAIELGLKPEVLENCTGCGLCVQVCPSGALEYNLVNPLMQLKNQGTTHASASESERVPSSLKCSKVLGESATLECLGRVTPAMLLAASAWGQDLTLLHNDCATCKLGGASVPDSLENVIAIAKEYKKNLTQPQIAVQVRQVEADDTSPKPLPAISRRDALRSFGRRTRESTAKLIPERFLPGVDTKPEAQQIPDEWVWRKKALRPTPEPQALQYWVVPSVDENCIFCPVCQNVCPTNAITREREMDGMWKIRLEVQACTGCNACVTSCPPSAMKLEPLIEFSLLEQTILLREGDGYT